MKLLELQTIAPVNIGSAGATSPSFREVAGWDLNFSQGIVTIRRPAKGETPELVRLVPMANVAWMTPSLEEKPKG